MAEPRRKRPGETTFGVLLLLAGLAIAWQAYGISGFSALSSPGAFPMAAAAAMVAAGLIVVIADLRKPRETGGSQLPGARAVVALVAPPPVVLFTGLVIGFALLLDPLGFLPASSLFLLLAIWSLHRRSIWFSLAVSLGALVAVYVVFRLIFTVILPEGVLPEREILAWLERLIGGW